MPRIRAATIDEHKELTRRQILASAGDLFRADGYADTTLRDISAAVGIGRTTLYEYFTDKEDVLVNLVEDTIPAVVDGLLTGLPDDISCRDRLAELIVRGLEFVSSDTNLGATLMRELPKLSPPAQRRVRKAHERLEAEMTRLCRVGIERGEFRQFDPIDAGRLVSQMMMSASQSLVRDAEAKQRMHEVADTLVRFVFDGLA
ncbi:MAG TPA: TetR/AcrR family transcriptional regulator, partial [Acidimicrobiia bacterium]|nr:TetR/AcrR family transcriptional regulator [Acidimicrobiia bacterium]